MEIKIRKQVLTLLFLAVIQTVFADGLLTKTFQSAQYARMLSRNASTGTDAVYYNPAGLILLKDGWHFSLNNQFNINNKTIDSRYPLLNHHVYEGNSKFAFFPSGFAVYKKSEWAFSFGFGQFGGDGITDFKYGLPTFEIPVSNAVPRLEALTRIDESWNVTGYDANVSFYGNSVFNGIQFSATYKVNNIFSVFGGIRYLSSKNRYTGDIENVRLKLADQADLVSAPAWLRETSDKITNVKIPEAFQAVDVLNNAVNDIDPLVEYYGSYTIDEIQGAEVITVDEAAQMKNGLQILNYSTAQIAAMDMATIQEKYAEGAVYYNDLATVQLPATAKELAGSASQLEDKHVDTEQTGSGITPMFGVQVVLGSRLNISLKYELNTYLQMTNRTKADDLGLFPDEGKSKSNIPALMAVGIGYNHSKWLEAQLSCNFYFDKGVDWGYNSRDASVWRDVDFTKVRMREIDRMSVEVGLGLQFNINDNFAVSVGGLSSNPGVNSSYQSDFSYTNPAFTAGGGFMYKVNERMIFDAGVSSTFYKNVTLQFTDPRVETYTETLGRSSFNFAIGLSYQLF